jgi:hypothetical protein
VQVSEVTDTVTISLVGALATVAVSIVNAAFAWLTNQRGKRNETHLVATKEAVQSLQVQTDGMQEKLLAVTADASRAKGVIEGTAAGIIQGTDAEKCRFKGDDAVCKFPGAV